MDAPTPANFASWPGTSQIEVSPVELRGFTVGVIPKNLLHYLRSTTDFHFREDSLKSHALDSPVARVGSWTTFIDVLRSHAEHHPSRTAITFLENGERESESITFAELDRRARAIAVFLQHVLDVQARCHEWNAQVVCHHRHERFALFGGAV